MYVYFDKHQVRMWDVSIKNKLEQTTATTGTGKDPAVSASVSNDKEGSTGDKAPIAIDLTVDQADIADISECEEKEEGDLVILHPIRTFSGHTRRVTSCCFSDAGTKVLTGGNDMKIRLWDAKTGAEERRFEGHSSAITSVVFSPGGETVLSGGWDKTIRLWSTDTGKELRCFLGGYRPLLALFSGGSVA